MTATPQAAHDHANTLTAAAGLIAAIAGAVAMVWLGMQRADAWHLAAAIVFSASMVALHLASTLYHAATNPAAKGRLKLVDHCAIYVLIAGTYTPFTLIGLRGTLGWTLFITIWSLAALGIVFKLVSKGRLRVLSTIIYVAMGWLVLIAIKPVMAALDGWTLGWLIAGGAFYTFGTLFYHRPSLPYAHAIWHLFVIGGGVCHYIAVLAQVRS